MSANPLRSWWVPDTWLASGSVSPSWTTDQTAAKASIRSANGTAGTRRSPRDRTPSRRARRDSTAIAASTRLGISRSRSTTAVAATTSSPATTRHSRRRRAS